MGDKSVQKKKYIIERAREVFCKKGYKNVTMKDIVEACEISRGGLYLYFSSTKEIFDALLEEDAANKKDLLESESEQDYTPGDLLLLYLSNKKKEILDDNELSKAMYEYSFEMGKNDNIVRKYFDDEVETVKKLITDGVEQEWMVCDDISQAAKDIVYAMEGLKISSQTFGISENEIDREITYLLGLLGLEVE